nr:GRAM domain-containing protein 2A isoform X7 [Equus caballus]
MFVFQHHPFSPNLGSIHQVRGICQAPHCRARQGGGCKEGSPAGIMAHDQAPELLHWPKGSKGEEIKKCSREGTSLSKYNQQYHKLFKDIPLEEVVLKVCSCALQRDLLLQGRLYISPNWLCFHASLFGKDIKVVIPVVSVQMIKKHKMARLLPNGLAITTNTSQKYVFVSLLSRDSVYDMLRRVCKHLQPSSKKSLSVREFPEEPKCQSLEVLIPEMKWRKVCPASGSLSLPANIPCVPRASMDSSDSFFPSRKPPGSGQAKQLRRIWGGGHALCWTGVLPAPGRCPTALLLQRRLSVRRRSWRKSPGVKGN